MADASVKPVGNQIVPQTRGIEAAVRIVDHRLRRIGNDLSAHGRVGAHNGGLALVVFAGIKESTLTVFAVRGAPGDHSHNVATASDVIKGIDVFLRPGYGPDIPQIRAILGPDGNGLGNRHLTAAIHTCPHPAVAIVGTVAAIMAGAIAKIQIAIRDCRAVAEAVAIGADCHAEIGSVSIGRGSAIVCKQQLVDIPGEVDIDHGLAVGIGRGRVIMDLVSFFVDDFESGLTIEVSHTTLAGLAHGSVKLFLHLSLNYVQQVAVFHQ